MHRVFAAGWARIGDAEACLVHGNHDACERLLWTYWLWPRLQEVLRQILNEPRIVVRPPSPDPPPFRRDPLGQAQLVELVIAQYEAGPQPEPPTRPARIEFAKALRDAFEQGMRLMEAEIKQLEAQ